MVEELTKDCKKSYGQILKRTAVFGSVKMFSVLVGLFKAKIIAIFLGPTGMGIFNLINYPITLVSQFSGLGISTSGVREIAQVQSEKELSEIAVVIRYWNRTLGIIGSLLLFGFAPYVSMISFGDDSYTWAFQVLSVVVFLTNLGGEYEVLLRGRRETKLVAKAGFYSSLVGFIASIPFYYAFGIPGIIVVILITALTLASINYLYARKLNIQPIKLSYREIFMRGQNMASIGFFIVLGDLIFVSVITIVNTFIRSNGGIEDVGYFQACMQITQSSINIVLIAMAADYFPRLSSLQANSKETSIIASQQAEVATLLCAPILITLIVFIPYVIKILLSEEFICIEKAISWFLIGSIFRLPSWAMNFVVLAKGKTKLYVMFVVVNNLLLLPLYCIGYMLYSIEGIGMSYIVLMILYTVIQNIIVKKELDVAFEKYFWRVYIYGVVLTLLTFIVVVIENIFFKIAVSAILLLLSYMYSIKLLNQKTDFLNKIKNKLNGKAIK